MHRKQDHPKLAKKTGPDVGQQYRVNPILDVLFGVHPILGCFYAQFGAYPKLGMGLNIQYGVLPHVGNPNLGLNVQYRVLPHIVNPN